MHSTSDKGRRCRHHSLEVGVLAVALMLSCSTTGSAQPPSELVRTAAPSSDEVTAALERLRHDTDLAPERQMQTLRWQRASAARTTASPGWLTWLRGLGRWMNQSTRYLIWVAVGIAAGLLALYLFRAVSGRRLFEVEELFVAPTHVGDLDIRPEALPSDIGAAARALWDSRDRRAALALLYRGLLSRLAHVHRVPIRDSSTEGDCLVLTAAQLPLPTHDYAARLVRVWQRLVYGHQPATDAVVYQLCDEFGPALDRPADVDARQPGGAT